MLSAKVTYAIRVIVSLARTAPNRQGRGVVPGNELLRMYGSGTAIARTILKRLTRYEFLVFRTTEYALLRQPATITLYEPIELFHGGVVIGEMCDTPASRRGYPDDPAFEGLVRFESALKDELSERFREITIQELVSLPRERDFSGTE